MYFGPQKWFLKTLLFIELFGVFFLFGEKFLGKILNATKHVGLALEVRLGQSHFFHHALSKIQKFGLDIKTIKTIII